jgi:hypothetical protein
VAVKPQAITDNECTVFTSAFTEDKVLATWFSHLFDGVVKIGNLVEQTR